MDETQLVHYLHDLATSIAAAKAAHNADAVRGLWIQFQAAADQYTQIGASDLAVLNLINSVGAGVEAFLKESGAAVGTATGDVLGGLFGGLKGWTLVLVIGAGVWVAWPYLMQRRGAARG